MSRTIKNTFISFIVFLLILAWWSSLNIGLSGDEYSHHINGLKRFNFLITLGEAKNYHFYNHELYPGIYDTLSYALGLIIFLINDEFYANNIDFVMHLINITFSSLSILGLYLLTKKIFNQNIAILAVFLTLANPFFFGHMGMNPKDIIIFFSLIWSSYYLYQYFINDEKIKNLLFSSFFIGFGCGVRLPFIILVFPIILCGFIYLFNKYKSQYLNLSKRLFLHFLISFLTISFLIIICWPHMIVEIQNGNFIKFLSSNILRTLSFNEGPTNGLINGEYYKVINTPKSYFFDIIIYRLPFYFTILVSLSYFLILTGNLNKNNEISNFKTKFLIINLIPLFPIVITIVMNISVYDNLRLFLFIIPFFSIIGSLSLYQFIKFFKNSWKNKVTISFILILFSISFYRFVILTPYQYDYINYSSLKFKNAQYKWEHDYWATSYKELVSKIKKDLSEEEISNLKIANCVADKTLLYYLYRYLGIKFIYNNEREDEANHVILINRALLKETTCNEYYVGENVVTVSRNGVILSALRKLDK